MRGNLKFNNDEHNGWIYFGEPPEINKEIIMQNINDHFMNNDLFISNTRTGSFQSTKQDVFDSIQNFLCVKDFSIWNSSFNRVIDFNKIGVLRCGIRT